MKRSKILGLSGLFFILLAAVVVIWVAYLNDIGFQAFFFFGVLVGCSSIWLHSNANDTFKDAKTLEVDLSLFHTSRGYAVGGALIVVIVAILYVIL